MTDKDEKTTAGTEAQSPPDHRNLGGKYLTFKLGPEEYGLEILKVQEIIKMMEITRIPRMPDFMRGVINLRGKVIPVIDLRLKFEMNGADQTEKTCIIVVQVTFNGNHITVGIVVDEVSEVLDIEGKDIEAPPVMGTSVETNFILGMAKSKGRVKILLDIEKVLSVKELLALSGTVSE